ncbi:MAG: hypothetical protein R3F43_13360 [bacterium]
MAAGAPETIEPERRIVVWDGFADADRAPSADLPETRMEIAFEATGKGSRFTAVSTFQSLAALERVVAMGMVEESLGHAGPARRRGR